MAEVVTRVMVVDMVNKAVAMAANRAVMAGKENAVMNAEMMIHMESSKEGATAGAMAGSKEGMVETANAATSDTTMILTGNSKAEAMAAVNKVAVMAEGSKAVAMAEVIKADMTKVAVVATALKTVLAEDMEEEGISFKKVEDQAKALEVISIPTKL
jgi:hypothetical protein